MAKVKQGADPGPNKGCSAAELRTRSHRQLGLDPGHSVREFQLPRELKQTKTETTVTAARATLPVLNGGGGPPVS